MRSTELESRNTLRDLQAVKETPQVDIPRPGVYTDPPQIIVGSVNGVPEAKLYYFARHQMVDTLMNLFSDQFVKVLYDNEGTAMPTVPYTADMNPSTHQLIVSCPSAEYARQVLDFLEEVDVPPIQVKIDCIISEIYADHTLDWDTRLAVQNLLGLDIELAGKLPGAALRDVARSGFGLKSGYVEGGSYSLANDRFDVNPGDQGHMFGALIDMLASRGYLKILMNPSLEVLAGQTATIRTEENVTMDNVDITQGTVNYDYRRRANIIDSLEITPHVFANGMIGLRTVAVIGSKATPEGVTQVPIKTERRVTIDENRIRRGHSLLIGGIRKAEQRSVVRGVPGFKDLPLLGVLFSSKDFEERAKEVMFIITPTLSTGGVPNKDMIADIKRRHDRVKQSDLIENIKDPLGSGAYVELIEEEAIHAEVGRVKAEIEKAAANRKAEDLEKRIAMTTRQLEGERKAADRTVATADTQADVAEAAVKTSQTQAEEARAQAAELQKQIDAHKVAAEKAAAEAVAAKAAAEKAQAEAAAAQAAAEKARKEAEAAIAEWMKTRQKNGSGDTP